VGNETLIEHLLATPVLCGSFTQQTPGLSLIVRSLFAVKTVCSVCRRARQGTLFNM
jgi:hypothetical protein